MKRTELDHPLKARLAALDAHIIAPNEYEDLPELNDEMLATAVVNKRGQQFDIEAGIAEADQSNFATQEEVDTVFAKYGA